MIKRLFIIVFLSFIGLGLYSQTDPLDSLNKVFSNAKHDTTRCNLLVSIAEYLYSSNPDTVIPISEQTIRLADKNLSGANAIERKAFLKAKAVSLNNIGAVKSDQGDLSASIDYYLKSLQNHTDNQYKIGISESLNNIGIVYDNLGDAPKALEYFHKALKIQEELKLTGWLALTLNNIGYIYAVQNESAKALEYYNRSLNYRSEINDKEGIAQSLNNIANVYEKTGDPNCKKDKQTCAKEGQILALNNYQKCLDIQSEVGDKRGMAYSLNNIANFYRRIGDPNFLGTEEEKKSHRLKLAMEYLMKSLMVHEEIKNYTGAAYAYNNIAQVLIDQGKIKEALVYSNKCMQLGKQQGHPEIIYRSAGTLKKIHTLQNNFKEAFTMYELEMQMRDSINNLSNQKALITQNTKYEYEKKAAADSVRVGEEKKVINAQLKQEKTQRFALYGGLLLVALFGGVMFNRFKITQKQKHIIEKQKEIVDEKQLEILDSIHYAKRIQNALMANAEFIDQHLLNNFILFHPKDIVSGDFYWAAEHNNKFYLAVCDSTGHGVPGAFMSLLNMGFLTEAIKEKNIEKPNEIFNYVRERLIESMGDEGQKDGMDGILICYDKSNNTLEYSAANNEPILIRNKEVIELAKDRMPIGKGEKDMPFVLHSLELQKGDSLYLYTDGYADQFGGPKGKKFKYKQLNDLLLSINDSSCLEQMQKLSNEFTDWKGDKEQVDDVLVIGIKI